MMRFCMIDLSFGLRMQASSSQSGLRKKPVSDTAANVSNLRQSSSEGRLLQGNM